MAAGNVGLGSDEPLAPGCYSQLLFAADEENSTLFSFTSSSLVSPHDDTPKMLCFGDYSNHNDNDNGGATCMDSHVGVSNHLSQSRRDKRNGSGITATATPRKYYSKKPKPKPSLPRHANAKPKGTVKKVKLGERITALQQLVSPFGKTDTASVLHEALGYIRFLHDQVQVLSSPYLQQPHHTDTEEEEEEEKNKEDLQSRGLCLVPVDVTLHVAAGSNGADLWSSTPILDSTLSST